MSSAPWTIQRNKRKSPATSSTARKRVRISDDVGRRSTTPRSNSQKTLTQIAFVGPSSISYEENVDLQEVLVPRRPDFTTPAFKPRRLKRQDSTLTQMPWLDSKQQDESMDDALLPNPGDNNLGRLSIAQVDGVGESPQQSVFQHSSADNETDTSRVLEAETGRRDSRTTMRPGNKTGQSGGPPASARRRSGRIASKTNVLPDDPKVSPKTSNEALYTPVRHHSRITTHHPAPLLEIQDSTEFDDLQVAIPQLNPQQHSLPQTPRRGYIASSQTPETAVRNTAKSYQNKHHSPSKSMRTPLKERSANIQATPQTNRQRVGKTTEGSSKAARSQNRLSPPRKLCVLKVPPRALLSRTHRVDDPQQDVYSLHATSSPRSEEDNKSPSNTEHPPSIAVASERVPDITVTGDIQSSPPGIDTQASLPTLRDLLPNIRTTQLQSADQPRTQEAHHQAAAGDAIDIQDFCRDSRGLAHVNDPNEMLLDVEVETAAEDPVEDVPENVVEEVDESDVEMGSPILNDTQFDAELKQRTSSPVSAAGTSLSQEQNRLSDTVEFLTPTQPRHTQVHFTDVPDERVEPDARTPLPTPRLVKRTSPVVVQAMSSHNVDAEDTEEPVLPRLARQSSTHVSISKVLLNDISSSSTPLAVPTQRTMTQKSIHPASMPRPSQMSTQEPTQSYLLSSMIPSMHPSHHVDRITIKDSSSSDGHLNEIPEHLGQSQIQGLNVKLVIEDSEEELDDLDLDPVTGSKHSARKPISRQVTKTNSSLKSIHISTLSSSEHEHNPSSSSSAFEPLAGKSSNQKPRWATPKSRKPPNRMSVDDEILDVLADLPTSSPTPPPFKQRRRSPIPGFDNDTQSDFTQNGHVTAAYIHKQRDLGRYPEWFVPKPTSAGGPGKRKRKTA